MANTAAIEALQKPKAQHGRNVFPLDNRQIYSFKSGQIEPVKCFHFIPGDYFDIKASDFSMTFPMNTAAFLRGRKEFKFYSVYYNAVWSLYNQYMAQRADPKSSAFEHEMISQEPRIPIYNLLMGCYSQFFYYITCEYLTIVRNDNINDTEKSALIKEFLDTSFNAPFDTSTASISGFSISAKLSDFSASLYNASNTRYLFNDLIPHDFDSHKTNRDYCCDIVGHYRVYSWLRKLDMLGYGNYYTLFRECENAISEIVSDTDTATNKISAIGNQLFYLEGKLLYSCLTWDSSVGSIENTSTHIPKMINLYPICAYNSVFYHCFRNSFYDNDYTPRNYSLDFASVVGENVQVVVVYLSDFGIRFLDIEYHQWKKDTFTAVLPYQQYGAVSSVSLTNVSSSDVGRWTTDTGGTPSSANVSLNMRSQTQQIYSASNSQLYQHTHDVQSSFDVVSLRRAEMLQEYRQALARAGNRTSDVFRALYGGAPSSEHEDDVIPRFLETFGADMFVDPVVATANTEQGSNGTLGDLSARGKISSQSGHVKFNAGNNFGLILCLTYFVPTAEYNSYMIDKHLFELTPEQHFIPQFENLGLEEVYTDELNCLIPANQIQSLGLAPRYHHKKTAYDQVHGAFCSSFVWDSSVNFDTESVLNHFYGDFNHWVSPRTDFQNRKNTQVRDFYINPSVLDNVFVRAASPDQADDQFICTTFFNVTATREMSKVGLINFV